MKIAILGYGNIGSGVAEVLLRNHDYVAKKAGQEINVKYVLDLREFPGDPMEDCVVHDIQTITEDPEVKIVVETMGGLHPAYEFVKACLEKGKSIATSNKELVAEYGAELMELAEKQGANFLFEASVGGGIPIIRPLNQSVTSDEIYEITGILNGTTNYMLTRMSKDGVTFDEILKKAQDLGYAERNPAADIEGKDACRKIAILSSLAFGANVEASDVHTEGITSISDVDMKYASKMGMVIKLFGTSRMDQDRRVFAMVAPVLVKPDHPLYHVDDVMNGILVRGEVIGDLMFYGAGAGKLPTASAVVADVIDEACNMDRSIMRRWTKEKLELEDFQTCRNAFFVRVKGNTEDNKRKIKELFGAEEYMELPGMDEFAFCTEEMEEAAFEQKAKQAGCVINRIRIAR